jgi:hypothetical protein
LTSGYPRPHIPTLIILRMARVSSQTPWCYSRIQTKSLAFVSASYFRPSEERASSGSGSELMTDGGANFKKLPERDTCFFGSCIAWPRCTPQAQLRIHMLMQLHQVPGSWLRACRLLISMGDAQCLWPVLEPRTEAHSIDLTSYVDPCPVQALLMVYCNQIIPKCVHINA